jgi:hypothetical protein
MAERGPKAVGGDGDAKGSSAGDTTETSRPEFKEFNGRHGGSSEARSTVTAGEEGFALATFGAQPSSQQGIAAPILSPPSAFEQQEEQRAPIGAARQADARTTMSSFLTRAIVTPNGSQRGCK